MQKYQLYLFDFDGTLFDTLPSSKYVFKKAYEYLGYKKGGFFGALLSTLGVIITPFVLMFCISLFLENILSVEAVKYAFMGVKVGVVFLLLRVTFTLVKSLKKDWFGILLLCVVTTAMVLFTIFAINFSAIYFILIGAVLGLLIYGIIPKKRREN